MKDVFASVDLGGTNVKCVFADAEGRILRSRSIPTLSHEGPDGVIERMATLIKTLESEANVVPRGLGIGIPGLVDIERGIIRFMPNFPTRWHDVPIREILSPRIGCQVYLLNDVRMATLGELVYGHGRSAPTLVFLALGTGIGGGVAVDGKLRLGPMGAAGELGHQTIIPDGPICGCGNRGCLETLASGPAISAAGVRLLRTGLAPRLHELVQGEAGRVSPETMAVAAAAGDENVKTEILRAAQFLGIGVANMVTALHPDMVVIGGGVAQMGDILTDTIRHELKARVRMFPVEGVRIERSQLGESAGTLGGIALAARDGLLHPGASPGSN